MRALTGAQDKEKNPHTCSPGIAPVTGSEEQFHASTRVTEPILCEMDAHGETGRDMTHIHGDTVLLNNLKDN